MNDIILFSAVGDTDPYRDNFDGAMTHIVRYYKPTKVYLYLSYEKMNEENLNHRYSRAIHYLNNNIEIEIYPKKEEELIKDVHKYDVFYSQFLSIINDIKTKYPQGQLLLNMSSGTPAMKTSITLLKILFTDLNTKLIQVATPKKKSNANIMHEKVTIDEDVEFKMSELFENIEEELGMSLNRCTEEDLTETIKIITIDNINKMFLKRDYCGIYNILEERKSLFNDEIINYSKHLYYRYIGENNKALEIARKLGKEDELYKIKGETTKRIIEKYNILSIKLRRQEYQEYLLGLGPLIEEIVKKMIEKRGIQLSKFVYIAKKDSDEELRNDNNINVFKLKENYINLYNILESKYKISTNEGWRKLNWYNMVKILDAIYNDSDKLENIPEKIKIIGDYRKDRNLVAHTLKSRECNLNDLEKVQKELKFLIMRIKVGQDEDFKNSMLIYEHIEEIIKKLLNNSLIVK